MKFLEQFLLMLQLLQLTFITCESSCVIGVGKVRIRIEIIIDAFAVTSRSCCIGLLHKHQWFTP